jgi:hypothetical protein
VEPGVAVGAAAPRGARPPRVTAQPPVGPDVRPAGHRSGDPGAGLPDQRLPGHHARGAAAARPRRTRTGRPRARAQPAVEVLPHATDPGAGRAQRQLRPSPGSACLGGRAGHGDGRAAAEARVRRRR